MDKKALLAVALSLLIWVTWQKFYLEPIQKQAAMETQRQEQQKAAREETKADLNAKGILPPSERKKLELREIAPQTLENVDAKLVVNNDANAAQAWDLKSFSKTLEVKDDKITMVGITGFPAQIGLRFSDNAYTEAVNTVWSAEKVAAGGAESLARLSTPQLDLQRKVVLDATGYGARVDYAFRFKGETPKYVFLDLYGSPKRVHDKEGSIFGQAPDKVHVAFRDSKGRHSELASNHKDNMESAAGVKWLGLDTRYFVMAMVPDPSVKDAGAQLMQDDSRGPAVRGSLVYPTEGKKEFSVSTKVYFGPKELESLRNVDPALVDTIDFGWTSVLAVPLLHALKWLYGFVHNYGFAIMLLTFGIKMLLFPLTYKSMKSMSKIAKLQPQLNALREKYKDNKEKLNVEMMNFMKTNGYNPLGGCLPILIQMPIFFALYRVLFNSMELYQAPFILWIHDLSSPDPYFITPVLLCGLMYLQQKLSPSTATDPMQQKMLQFMPVIFGVFMLLLPAGLNIYMVVNSATSIAQQWVLNRKLGITPGANAPAKA